MEPKRDQWWRLKDGTIVFVAFDDREINKNSRLRFLTYYKISNGNLCRHWRNLPEFDEHLPECTGFEWVPEVFPQYWTTGSPKDAFVKRIDKDRYVFVNKEGKEGSVHVWYFGDQTCRTQLTEEQAMAMLVKWPRYFVCNIHSPGYYRCDSETEVWHITIDGAKKQECTVSTMKVGSGVWTEVAEAEALARVAKGPVVQAAQWETVVIGGKTFEVREVAK